MADPVLTGVVADMSAEIVRGTARATYSVWAELTSLSDEAAETAIAQVVPLVGGAQRSVAAQTANYLARVTDLELATPVVAELIPEADWVRSPMIQARRLVGEGTEVVVAFDLAARRAAQVHTGDVLRARNDATTAYSAGVEPLRPVRWAKLPLPNACAWCHQVSTRLYYRPDGMPVHLHCRCGLEAVTPDEASRFSNAATAFENYRWRSRVSTPELRAAQRRMADEAARLAAASNAAMSRAA